MPKKTPIPEPNARIVSKDDGVEAFITALDHPHKSNIVALRDIIVDADPSIAAGIKWNSLSFRTSEWFATINLRAKTGVQIIMHFGAKKTAISETGIQIQDPRSLLEWLAKDRASIVFLNARDIASKRSSLTALLREWIKHV